MVGTVEKHKVKIRKTSNNDNLCNNVNILGARHTVYYTRIGQEATLLIDRIEVPLEKLPPQGLWEVFDVGSNEVQIGGLNTTDPRLKIYKGYNGCLSSEYKSMLMIDNANNT